MGQVAGTNYASGTFYTRLYPGSGVAIDWSHGQGLHSYLFELRDRGAYGFFLPIDQLVPTAEEAWAGLVALAEIPEPPRLWLEADPIVAGGTLTVQTWRANAQDVVSLWTSTVGRGTTAAGTVDLDLASAVHGIDGNADAQGHATLTLPVPGSLQPGDPLWLQAATADVASVIVEGIVQ